MLTSYYMKYMQAKVKIHELNIYKISKTVEFTTKVTKS